MSDRAQFVGWIADRFQERHSSPLQREEALRMAEETLTYVEGDNEPYGHPDYAWDQAGAQEIADDEISTSWEMEA